MSYTLAEAANLLGWKIERLRKRASRDLEVFYGERNGQRVRLISEETMQVLLEAHGGGSFESLKSEWEKSMRTGSMRRGGRRLSENTIYSYTNGLKQFWYYLGVAPDIKWISGDNLNKAFSNPKLDVDYEKRKDYRGLKKAMYEGVYDFSKFLVRKGMVDESIPAGVNREKPRPVFEPEQEVLASPEEFHKLLDINKSYKPRQRTEYDIILYDLMIRIFVGTGLRRAELLDVKLNHIDFINRSIRVIDGKGMQNGVVGMPKDVIEGITEWLDKHRAKTTLPYLIVSRTGGRIAPTNVSRFFRRLSELYGKRVFPHMLRASCATFMVKSGAPLTVVKDALRHKNIRTTDRYIRSNVRDLLVFCETTDFTKMEEKKQKEQEIKKRDPKVPKRRKNAPIMM